MRFKHGNMNVYVFDNYDKMSEKGANILAGQIHLKPDSILGLATGSTPIGTYDGLISMYKAGEIDFSDVRSFNLDEYYPIEPTNDQSYAYFMNEHLFKHINMAKENIHIPAGNVADIEKECEKYDNMMEEAGLVDVQILGIGTNGHIGFNEPDDKFEKGTHKVDLDEETIKSNARFFEKIDDVPRQAISMGIGNIMRAKKVVLMASGENKAKIIKEMILGDITPRVPASILQLHPDVTILLDKEAAGEILNLL